MIIYNNEIYDGKLYRSLYFIFYPFLRFVFAFDALVFLLILSTSLSQTTLSIAPAFYYIKWAVLILFIVIEYLIVNFLSLTATYRLSFKLPRSYIVLFLFFIYIAITSLYSTDMFISLFKSGTFFFLIFISLVLIPFLTERLSDRKKIIKYIYAFLIFILIMNILAFKIYPVLPSPQYMYVRYMGFFDNPNTLGMICFISIPILLYKYKVARKKWIKLFNILLIVTAIILPLVAASRASLLGIAIVFAVYFYFFYRRLFYIGVILALVSVFFVLFSPVLLELMRLAEDPLSQRDKIWELGLAGWKENIIFGAGYGTTEIFTSNIYMFLNKGLTEFVIGKRFGNIYIEILYETGIVGFLLFLTSILLLVKETWRIIKRSVNDERIFTVCYFGLLIAVIFQSIFESFISSAGNASSLIFWILTGMVIGRDSIKRIDGESYT